MPIAAVLFDFDGTLVDTRTASWPLFAETSREFDLGIETREQFFALFEHNIYESLARHCGDAARAQAAAQHFLDLVRDHYAPPFIDGIDAVLDTLARERTLAILSSNHSGTVRRLLESGGVAAHFSHVYGGDMQPSKAAAIADFLAGGWDGTGARRYDADEVVLVSDTSGDVAEARAAGIRALGVAWGMHDAARLAAAGAAHVAHEPPEILRWIAAA